MTLINWIALVLAVVLWIIHQYIGHSVGMMSSQHFKKGSRMDVYLDRVQAVEGIIALGALVTFITQLLDNAVLKSIGLISLAIALLALATLPSGLLNYRLPVDAPEKDE